MSSLPNVLPTYKGRLAMETIVDLDPQALQELERQRAFMDVPPFNTPPRKLQAAFEGIVAGKIAWNPLTARWQVEGSKGTPYEVSRDGCSCPNGQNGTKTRFNCWHACGAELYDRWRKALTPSLRQEPAMATYAPPTEEQYTPEPEAPRPPVLAEVHVPTAWPGVALKAPPTTEPAGCALSHEHIERSSQVALLMTALARAQAQMTNPAFDSSNPHYRTRYASLAAVREAITPALTAHGIALTQLIASQAGEVVCTTVLWHTSGQYLSSTLRLPVGKPDAQGYGGAITYARRYSLMGICNVAGEEDDDGESAAGRTETPAAAPAQAARTELALRREIVAQLHRLGIPATTAEDFDKAVQKATGYALKPEYYPQIVRALQALAPA